MLTTPLTNSAACGTPAMIDMQAAAPIQPAAGLALPGFDHRPPRILIVDDEPINIKVARKYLAGAGFTDFYSTSNASEVLPLIMRAEPDVVLLDIVMPH